MKPWAGTLALITTLSGLPLTAQEPGKPTPPSEASEQAPAKPAVPEPKTPPPPPPADPPKPPARSDQTASEKGGQWVYTEQYGWVWMPYGDRYTHLPPDGSVPHMYVYEQEAGWCWVAAPWLWGWGPMPYFGVFGPRYYTWFGVGLGHWYGFRPHYAYRSWGGPRYWHGGGWSHWGGRGGFRSFGGGVRR